MRTLGGSCSKAGPPASCVVAKNSIGGFEGQTLKEFLSLLEMNGPFITECPYGSGAAGQPPMEVPF